MCFIAKIVSDSVFPRHVLLFGGFQHYERDIYSGTASVCDSWLVTHIFDAHAQVVKRVADLHDDGSIKPFSGVEGQEADYVHRCCRLSANTWGS